MSTITSFVEHPPLSASMAPRRSPCDIPGPVAAGGEPIVADQAFAKSVFGRRIRGEGERGY